MSKHKIKKLIRFFNEFGANWKIDMSKHTKRLERAYNRHRAKGSK